MCAASASAATPEPCHPAPKLPPPSGRIVSVADVEQFRKAVAGAKDGDTIALADGDYNCVPYVWMKDKHHVTIRGASGDPTKVKLTGKGFDKGGDHDNEDIFWLDSSENITFADLTFAETHAYGLKINSETGPKNIKVYNCHFRDIGIRGIKGTANTSTNNYAKGGEVRYCWFENTKIPPSNWQFDGDYITSIDMMRLDEWVFADNVFKNIKGRNGQARGAIFVWVGSKHVTVERNVFIDCDRGVCFGNAANGDKSTHIKDSVCRNNFFVTSSSDAPIEISWAEDIKVFHNSILKTCANGHNDRGIRVISNTNCKNIEIDNNIFSGSFDGAEAKERGNYSGPLDGYFVDPAHGNLRLTAAAVNAIGKGVELRDVRDDYDGHARSKQPDIGASQFAVREPEKSPEKVADIKSERQPSAATPIVAVASGPHRDALVTALQNPGAAKDVKVFVTVFGSAREARFKGADATGPSVELDGNIFPMRWKEISDAELAAIAFTVFHDSAEPLFHAGALAHCVKASKMLEKISTRLHDLDAARARELDGLAVP